MSSLLYELKRTEQKVGVATLCMGTGTLEPGPQLFLYEPPMIRGAHQRISSYRCWQGDAGRERSIDSCRKPDCKLMNLSRRVAQRGSASRSLRRNTSEQASWGEGLHARSTRRAGARRRRGCRRLQYIVLASPDRIFSCRPRAQSGATRLAGQQALSSIRPPTHTCRDRLVLQVAASCVLAPGKAAMDKCTFLRNALRQKRPALGTWLTLSGTAVARTVASVPGLQWILIDAEHGQITDRDYYEVRCPFFSPSDLISLVNTPWPLLACGVASS